VVVDFIVGLAALIQYAAAILALRVLRITGKELAWLLITAVVFLQAIRRSVVLYRSFSHDAAHPPDLAAECVGLAISVVMLVGVARIGPFFLSILESKDELRKRSHDLGERVKELNCLYKMAGLTDQPNVSLEQVIEGTVDLIPPACRYPRITCARVILESRVFETTGFEETPWKLDRDIVVHGEQVGTLEVCHREKRSDDDEDLFLKEERDLINTIVGRLGRIIERVWVEEDREALQEQLHQAQKMEAVGQLAAGVAHDFSNLLTVIRGHTDRVSNKLAKDDTVHTDLDMIQQATHQAGDLTRALLMFSRKLPTEKKPIDLCNLIRELERLLRRVLPAAVELEVNIVCESPLWVSGDQTQLQQVILNLAVNARDAMPDGGTLCVSLSPAAESDIDDCLPQSSDSYGSFARLVVTDTGVGMPPEVRSRIFEPFYTTKTRGQGTGLGLSIVHGVLNDHGGGIEVQSEVGKGTTFTLVLPCIQPVSLDDATTPSTIMPQGTGELILLAEDNQYVRGIIASTLESLGYEVIQARNGPTTLELYAERRDEFRLFMLDVNLPGCSGLACLRELRESGITTPAIVITGNITLDPDELDSETILLRKPFGMPELARAVSKALDMNVSWET